MRGDVVADDDFFAEFFNVPTTKEALTWLQGGTKTKQRTLGEDERQADSIQTVEELYAAGAVQVLAVEIQTYDKGASSSKLVIELPERAAYRKMVIDLVNQIGAPEFDPEVDEGQRYVFVMLN